MNNSTDPGNGQDQEPDFILAEVQDAQAGAGTVLRLRVARFPTTVAEYRKFIEAGGYESKEWWSLRGWFWRTEHAITLPKYWGEHSYDIPTLPVTGISFWEAEAYARFRNSELPTEREWYLLSSNGGESRFPWGNYGTEPSKERANLAFFGIFDGLPHVVSHVVPVNESTRSSSASGVRDLIGNVAEWCIPNSNPELAPKEMTGVLRGGASWHVPGVADALFRDVVPLTVRDNQTGIRLIRREKYNWSSNSKNAIGWPSPPRRLGRSIKRPTEPFRQEGIPYDLTEELWRLKVHGSPVPSPREFSLAELKREFKIIESKGLFVCVCRWGEYNEFKGVLLRDVLEACGISYRHRKLFLRQASAAGPDAPPYETTMPLGEAIDNNSLLAWEMDGKELSRELGWPLRFVNFTRYGYKCVKCLTDLIVTDQSRKGWWEEACQYDLDGTILPGTITVVGKDAMRFDIEQRGRVRWDTTYSKAPR